MSSFTQYFVHRLITWNQNEAVTQVVLFDVGQVGIDRQTQTDRQAVRQTDRQRSTEGMKEKQRGGKTQQSFDTSPMDYKQTRLTSTEIIGLLGTAERCTSGGVYVPCIYTHSR